jgi:hypothetical protein
MCRLCAGVSLPCNCITSSRTVWRTVEKIGLGIDEEPDHLGAPCGMGGQGRGLFDPDIARAFGKEHQPDMVRARQWRRRLIRSERPQILMPIRAM